MASTESVFILRTVTQLAQAGNAKYLTVAWQTRTMPAMDREIATRLNDLETRNSYLERNIQELSEGLYAQQRQIERMEAILRKVSERIKELGPGPNDLPQNERPPHY